MSLLQFFALLYQNMVTFWLWNQVYKETKNLVAVQPKIVINLRGWAKELLIKIYNDYKF